jgi:GNAT superfamily N-acetyltransferase
MTDSLQIRPATPADIPALIHHRSSMFIDIAKFKGEEIDPASLVSMEVLYEEYLETHFDNGSSHAWVAVDGEKVIAGAVITIIPGLPCSHTNLQGILPYIHDVYTQPDYRHKGLARMLVQTIIEFCRQQGYAWVKLHASSQGRAIYESLGFKDSNEMRLVL